jgi:hypothetical protein
MQKINIRKLYYHARHRYFTLNNVVIAVALVIGASWAWGSIGMMQRNYALQKEIDTKHREQTLAGLEVQNLAFEQKYYQSSEYQELAMRERLGVGNPGEKALVLPSNSRTAKTADAEQEKTSVKLVPESNFQQWMGFLFGADHNEPN